MKKLIIASSTVIAMIGLAACDDSKKENNGSANPAETMPADPAPTAPAVPPAATPPVEPAPSVPAPTAPDVMPAPTN